MYLRCSWCPRLQPYVSQVELVPALLMLAEANLGLLQYSDAESYLTKVLVSWYQYVSTFVRKVVSWYPRLQPYVSKANWVLIMVDPKVRGTYLPYFYYDQGEPEC